MKNLSIIAITLFLFTMCSPSNLETNKDLTQFVDLRIGVIDTRESNCVIGPQLPFASINPSPQTANGFHDGYSPNELIRGFGQLHVSGSGWGKYGQFLVSPQTGLAVGEELHDSPKSNELAQCYSYEVTLDRYNIKTELAPSSNSVIYRFTFPESDESSIVIDVVHSLVVDIATMVGGHVHSCFAEFDKTDQRLIKGGGIYFGGFGDGEYPLHFSAELSKTPKSYGVWLNDEISEKQNTVKQIVNSDRAGAYVQFQTEKNEEVYLKLAISFKSCEQASIFLKNEIPDWNYEAVKQAGKKRWNKELNKIQIEENSDDSKTIFYTALYHSLLQPRNRTADNRLWENNQPFWDDHFAIWDTWRSMFPLLTILCPDTVASNVQSFIDRFEHLGIARDAFVAGIDMHAEQGGNNVDNVICDAILKDIGGFDYERAYALLKNNADHERNGWQGFAAPDELKETFYKLRGWIPGDTMSCSYTLEYAYNDFCIAQVASMLGKTADCERYMKRSGKWEELWNPNIESDGFTGFISPKNTKGDWIEIDAKKDWHSWKEYFYEANSWTYSFFVPHNFPRLIELSGGNQKYVKRLEHSIESGLLNISNEPSFAALRSFSYAQRPDLTSKWVRYIMDNKYDLTGYPGNDDSGAMSSWYIFSALGFFPNAGQDIYVLNSPKFKYATINLSNGNKIQIKAPNASNENIYIKWCKLNGTKLDSLFIKHSDILNGAVLEYNLVSEPIN